MSTTKTTKVESGFYQVRTSRGEVYNVKLIEPKQWHIYHRSFPVGIKYPTKASCVAAIAAGKFSAPIPTFPSAEELLALPVTCQSQVHDLHLENNWTPAFSGVRFWVSRCGIEDGEPYDNTVYVEVREWIPGNPSWYDLGHYDGDNPVESLAGYSPYTLGCGRDSRLFVNSR